jgi:Na+/serine symporter
MANSNMNTDALSLSESLISLVTYLAKAMPANSLLVRAIATLELCMDFKSIKVLSLTATFAAVGVIGSSPD